MALTKETYQEGLKRLLTQEVFELAIKRTNYKRRKKYHNLKNDYDILTGAFTWNKTKEGIDYWHNQWLIIYDK